MLGSRKLRNRLDHKEFSATKNTVRSTKKLNRKSYSRKLSDFEVPFMQSFLNKPKILIKHHVFTFKMVMFMYIFFNKVNFHEILYLSRTLELQNRTEGPVC